MTKSNIRSLWDRRAVIWAMAMASVRSRYQRASLGIAWAVLAPGLMALLIGVVYSKLIGRSVEVYAPFLFGGFFAWMFLTQAIAGGASVLAGSAGYVRQTTLPLSLYPVKHVVAGIVSFLFALVAVVIILIAMGQFRPMSLVAVVPGVLLLFTFGVSICILQSVIGTLFRDYEHLTSVTIRAVFFITPVLYPPDLMAQHGRAAFFQFNPLHYLITCVREPILTGEFPPATDLGIAAAITLATAFIGFRVFARYEKRLYALL